MSSSSGSTRTSRGSSFLEEDAFEVMGGCARDFLAEDYWSTDETICGYLWKSSGREKNKPKGFQKRWFRLSPSGLLYYKSKNETKPLKPVIPLENILSIVEAPDDVKKPHALQLVTQRRTFYLIASNDDERNVWLDAFNYLMRLRQFGELDDEDGESENSVFSNDDSCSEEAENFEGMIVRPPKSRIISLQVSLRDSTNSASSITPSSYQDEILFSDFDCDSPIETKGFLWKSPGSKKGPGHWQKRWFVIRKNLVMYFRYKTVSI